MWRAWIAATLVAVAHADEPKAPSNLHFADVCRYTVTDARLTCRDLEGNVLIDRARLFKLHLRQPYDELAVLSLMRREGFDLGARLDASHALYFQKNGCGR